MIQMQADGPQRMDQAQQKIGAVRFYQWNEHTQTWEYAVSADCYASLGDAHIRDLHPYEWHVYQRSTHELLGRVGDCAALVTLMSK